MRGATATKRSSLRCKMFQSTRPVRGATPESVPVLYCRRVSIHAPRAGRDFVRRAPPLPFRVSIHAPRAGRDRPRPLCGYDCGCFNPRAPCGARLLASSPPKALSRFQSTRPGRGAPFDKLCAEIGKRVSSHAPRAARRFCFNPRAPCGARQQKKLRLPSFATYLWVLLATNMIFSMSEQRTLLSCAAST